MHLRVKKVSVYVAGIFLLNLAAWGAAWAEPGKKYLKEAERLADMEKDYFQKRQNHDWQGVYDYQNPVFRKKISVEELQYFEGRVFFNYRDKLKHNISGGMTPSTEYIKAHPKRRDVLGFPRRSYFRWFISPYIHVRDYILESVALSKDLKYAMVKITLIGKEELPKALFRHKYEFDFKRSHVDYWEQVNGKWSIALLIDSASISGTQRHYFIPNDNRAWEKKEYVEVAGKILVPEPADGFDSSIKSSSSLRR